MAGSIPAADATLDAEREAHAQKAKKTHDAALLEAEAAEKEATKASTAHDAASQSARVALARAATVPDQDGHSAPSVTPSHISDPNRGARDDLQQAMVLHEATMAPLNAGTDTSAGNGGGSGGPARAPSGSGAPSTPWPTFHNPWAGSIQMWPGPPFPRPQPGLPQPQQALLAQHAQAQALQQAQRAQLAQVQAAYMAQAQQALVHGTGRGPSGGRVGPTRVLQPYRRTSHLGSAVSSSTFSTMTLNPPQNNEWYFDTGASSHMTSDSSTLLHTTRCIGRPYGLLVSQPCWPLGLGAAP
jgi:hypothetical protein